MNASLSIALTYRAEVILWLLSFIFPLVMLAAWLTVVAQVGPIGGFGSADFVSYYIAGTVVFRLTTVWIAYQWAREIQTGDLSLKLVKPIHPFHQFAAWQLGWKLFDVLVLVPLMCLVALLLPNVGYATDPLHLLTFTLSVAIGLAINTLISAIFGVIAFWTTQSRYIAELWHGVGQFLSGFVAPLALFPDDIQRVAFVLPFRYGISFPIEVLMGRLDWAATVQGLAIGLSWIIASGLIFEMLWRRGIRRYEAVGG
jgi:ABC-2 type transport system permease protein